MTLVKMKEILENAKANNYGAGAFSVANMEMVIGAVRAAEELRSPLILQIAEVRLKHSPLAIIGPAMVAAAKKATVPVYR
jgi:fructose-bisphosphate aldolase class II